MVDESIPYPLEAGILFSAKNPAESLLLAIACKREDRLYLAQQDVFLEHRMFCHKKE
jgi:hypothetical protein